MNEPMVILLQLLLAHVLTDFVLQPGVMVAHKRTYGSGSWFLYLHAFIAGLLTFILLQHQQWWLAAVFIGLSHWGIDLWKLKQGKDTLKLFLLDQLGHLLMILLVWLFLIQGFPRFIPALTQLLDHPAFLAIFTGYLLVIFPAGFMIGKATKQWQEEIELDHQNTSLEAAGRYIGIFERLLVLTFILTDHFSAIGFLIAAKSILRFSDKTGAGARKQTEYVLIGTLMSFSITILIGLLIRYFALQ